MTQLSANMLLTVVLSAAASLIAVRWVYFKILKIAKEKNVVDNPDARKLQKTPVPVMGGIAVFFGVVAGVLAGAALSALTAQLPVGGPVGGMLPVTPLLPVLAAMMVMLYVGSMDDVVGLTPVSRLVIEVLTLLGVVYASGGCIDSFHGLWGITQFSWWLGVPLTVFAGVGIINAVNMIDGVNGLSSGLCIACSVMFGVAFLFSGDGANALLAFSMAAALFPFLLHNVFGRRSRMFIGDAGTMVMGVLLSWFVICLLRSDSPMRQVAQMENYNMIALALAILSVPVFDTLRVMSMRMAHGRSPFLPDKTHLHHVFISVGVSHSVTALSEIMIDGAIVALWALSVKAGVGLDVQLYVVVAAAIVLVWGTYMVLRYNERRHTAFMHWLTRLSLSTHLGQRHWWLRLQRWLDAPEERDRAEEMRIVVGHISRRFDHDNPSSRKEQDRERILTFLKGKAEVFVDDVKLRSGADPMRVYPILFEEERAGRIGVVKRDGWGAPQIVVEILEEQ